MVDNCNCEGHQSCTKTDQSAMTIKELQEKSFAMAESKGFHDGPPNLWKFLGNLHSEVSEAWEEARKPDFDPTKVYTSEGGKPEGFPIELADLAIRLGDTAQAFGVDLEAAIRQKMAFNATRPFRHGNKRA